MSDNVGTPIGQQRTRHRDEHPLRQLNDTYALECALVHLLPF